MRLALFYYFHLFSDKSYLISSFFTFVHVRVYKKNLTHPRKPVKQFKRQPIVKIVNCFLTQYLFFCHSQFLFVCYSKKKKFHFKSFIYTFFYLFIIIVFVVFHFSLFLIFHIISFSVVEICV